MPLSSDCASSVTVAPETSLLSPAESLRVSRVVPAPRVHIRSEQPLPAWEGRPAWPARWLLPPESVAPPFVAAFRLRFTLPRPTKFTAVASADERYELFVDGRRAGRGPERGDALHWSYEGYEFELGDGDHVIVARIWALGTEAPIAQVSVRAGFIFMPLDAVHLPLLATGHAAWEVKPLFGYTFTDPMSAWGTGSRLDVNGTAFAWGFAEGHGADWLPAKGGPAGSDDLARNSPSNQHILVPSELPPMIDQLVRPGRVRSVSAPLGTATSELPIREPDHLGDELPAWQALISDGAPLTLPPRTRRRVIVDLENYYCAFHEIRTTGGAGAFVRICWQEALYDDHAANSKGHRDAIDGKYFVTRWWQRDGIGDTFRPDGGAQRHFESLWWHAGRYVELFIVTGETPLTLEHFALRETRYPLEMESRFATHGSKLDAVVPLAVRTLQMCSHETYLDCPYFEQLMYVGDTRIEALITYAISRDDRLARKALRAFHWSRLPNGLTQSRYPARVRQIIPPFSLWWVAMLHDFAFWRGDLELVRGLLPGARGVLDYFLNSRVEHELIGGMHGWNFLDWVDGWPDGVPPDGKAGANCSLNWQTVLALRQAADLEKYAGEKSLAARHTAHAEALAELVNRYFWDDARGLYADDLAHSSYSEHAQCLAVLAGGVPGARRARLRQELLEGRGLFRTTIYFSHYLFEAYRSLGCDTELHERLRMWTALSDSGFKTLLEQPEPSRSDCHAWAAHPLFHYFATLLGIRPAAPAFREVLIVPHPGPVANLEGMLVHPAGTISVKLTRRSGRLRGEVSLPPGISGQFVWNEQSVALHPGFQVVDL